MREKKRKIVKNLKKGRSTGFKRVEMGGGFKPANEMTGS